jgi:hypothetical protein
MGNETDRDPDCVPVGTEYAPGDINFFFPSRVQFTSNEPEWGPLVGRSLRSLRHSGRWLTSFLQWTLSQSGLPSSHAYPVRQPSQQHPSDPLLGAVISRLS